jgi:hypothetical protein
MSKGRGNFSIENIGKPFTTYVEEKVFETNLNRSLSADNNARPTAWGTLVEEQAFSKMGLEYSLVSKERYYKGDYWSGMPDLITDEVVGDIKCPWTLKSFCNVVKTIKNFNETKDLELFKKEHPEWYWQLVSNGILCKRDKAIFVVYCPYKEDLIDIKEMAESHLGDGSNRFAFITWAEDEDLPYLVKDGNYNDLNVMEFEIPQEDKDILTARVEMAIVELKKQLK